MKTRMSVLLLLAVLALLSSCATSQGSSREESPVLEEETPLVQKDPAWLNHEENCRRVSVSSETPFKEIQWAPLCTYEYVGSKKCLFRATCLLCGAVRSYSEEEYVAEYAPYYGIDPSIRPVRIIRTKKECINTVLYCIMTGDYTFRLHFGVDGGQIVKEVFYSNPEKNGRNLFNDLYICYGEIGQFYCSQDKKILYDNSSRTLRYEVNDPWLTPEKSFVTALEGVDMARQYYLYMHETGCITDGMTQREIAYTYNLKMRENPGKRQKATWSRMSPINGAAKSCFSWANATCAARANAYNLLMHMEGVSCRALQCENHDINILLIDGVEIFSDWGQLKIFGDKEEIKTQKNRHDLVMASPLSDHYKEFL